ncbi:MAG: DUF1697 domain-containing protein [Dermatophilaceae bacterium]
MGTWIALLRAVNVGRRQYPMAQLRAALVDAGFGEVETHIQTGNVRLRSPLRSARQLGGKLEEVFRADRGFDVATFVLTPGELSTIAADVKEVSARHTPEFGHYVSILDAPPSAADRDRIEGSSCERERVIVAGRAVHLLYDVPYHQAKSSNATLEKVVGRATNRNARVVLAMAEKWGG